MKKVRKMSVTIGIDIGGSTTKIVGFKLNDISGKKELISPLLVSAADPLTSLYGAFGKFISVNGLSLSDIVKVMVTGVGSSYLTSPIYSLACEKVPEFESTGRGGLYLTGHEKAIVVSMGTGTFVVYAEKGKVTEYLGGTGVGGGSLLGLSRLILGMDNIKHIEKMASTGDLSKIDLRVRDISNTELFSDMPRDMTAANFGKVSDIATKSDIALGIYNMVFETIAMVSLFAARSKNTKDIILTGNLTTMEMCTRLFPQLSTMFNINYAIPQNAQFATVIGAALQA